MDSLTSNQSDEMVGCPFCGSDNLSLVPICTEDRGDGFQIECDDCGARGPHESNGDAPCASWNNRTADEPTSSQWISVNDRLPKDGDRVIYAFNGRAYQGAYEGCNNEEGLPCFSGAAGWLTGDVMFWMPWPTAPESTRLGVTKDAGECGACDKPGEHCANVHGICSRHGGRAHETSDGQPWKCTICNNQNPDDATHCRQCEYSRTVMRDGQRVPRDGRL